MKMTARFGVSVFLALSAVSQADPAIKPAPAFTAAQLDTLPTSQWITNGGTLFNQRYSPLTLLNRGNVAGLKGLWRTSMGSAPVPGTRGKHRFWCTTAFCTCRTA